MKRVLMITGGGVALIAGLVLLFLPGPGIILVALGVGMLASEIPIVREWFVSVISKLPMSEEKKQKLRTYAEKQRHAH